MKRAILIVCAMISVMLAGCTQPPIGGETDSHGCLVGAGYSWCDASQKCIRVWEENCTSAQNTTTPTNTSTSDANLFALTLCENANISKIYVCGEYVRAVSSLLGGGSTFYKSGQAVAQCPVVGPDSMSDQCKQLLLGNNCVETEVSCPTAPGSDRDSHGCIPSAGYRWCDSSQKCIRPWEENCTLSEKEARTIASQDSACSSAGNLTNVSMYNNYTKTWWINIDAVSPGCSPACVVFESNRSTEVNWRCTGIKVNPLKPAVKVYAHATKGDILANYNGMSLYVFIKDSANTPTCVASCTSNWPPLVLGAVYTSNITNMSGTFGSVVRGDGMTQVTYNGMPLYLYVYDTVPGDILGDGANRLWYVAQPNMTTFPGTAPPATEGSYY